MDQIRLRGSPSCCAGLPRGQPEGFFTVFFNYFPNSGYLDELGGCGGCGESGDSDDTGDSGEFGNSVVGDSCGYGGSGEYGVSCGSGDAGYTGDSGGSGGPVNLISRSTIAEEINDIFII